MVAQHNGVLVRVQLLRDVRRPLLLPAAWANHVHVDDPSHSRTCCQMDLQPQGGPPITMHRS